MATVKMYRVLFVHKNCKHPLPEHGLHDPKIAKFRPVTVKLFSVPLDRRLSPMLKCSGLLNRLVQLLRVLFVMQKCHFQISPRPVFLNCRAAAPVPGPGINYTGPQEILLQFVILVF